MVWLCCTVGLGGISEAIGLKGLLRESLMFANRQKEYLIKTWSRTLTSPPMLFSVLLSYSLHAKKHSLMALLFRLTFPISILVSLLLIPKFLNFCISLKYLLIKYFEYNKDSRLLNISNYSTPYLLVARSL